MRHKSDCKVCSFWSSAFLALCSSQHTCARERTFFIFPRNSTFERLVFFSSKAHFAVNVFDKITGITDALKKSAHDENEQTIKLIMYQQPLTFDLPSFLKCLTSYGRLSNLVSNAPLTFVPST